MRGLAQTPLTTGGAQKELRRAFQEGDVRGKGRVVLGFVAHQVTPPARVQIQALPLTWWASSRASYIMGFWWKCVPHRATVMTQSVWTKHSEWCLPPTWVKLRGPTPSLRREGPSSPGWGDIRVSNPGNASPQLCKYGCEAYFSCALFSQIWNEGFGTGRSSRSEFYKSLIC